MDWLCIVGFWVLCGLIAGSIYSQKGRSSTTGFLAGLLLGPIGIILALASGKSQTGIEARELRSGKMKRCPYCGELVRSEATICKHCQQTLD